MYSIVLLLFHVAAVCDVTMHCSPVQSANFAYYFLKSLSSLEARGTYYQTSTL